MIKIQQQDFDVGAELAALSDDRQDVGAVASFVGLGKLRTLLDTNAKHSTQMNLLSSFTCSLTDLIPFLDIGWIPDLLCPHVPPVGL